MNRRPGNQPTGPRRLDALGVADGDGLSVGPGSLLLDDQGTVLAAGRPAEIDHHPASRHARREAFPDSILIPGLVNAHCHLDLTHIGPQPHDPAGGFVPWIEMVRKARRSPSDEAGVAESVRRGIALSIAGGTVAVGDIAGASGPVHTLTPWQVLRDSPLLGVSFVECFGIGRRRGELAAALERLVATRADAFGDQDPRRVRLGLQPHAPNTVAPGHYRMVAALSRRFGGLPLATHLAETAEERQFVAECTGPQRDMLERLGLWDEADAAEFTRAPHPVAHLAPVLGAEGPRFLVAHVNDAPDDAIETLARTNTSVAYCPRASEYFGAERALGPHRYRDMLSAGVPVALGTDSIVNLPPESARAEGGGISVLDEVRLLHRRDGADPALLLRMATIHGAAALGLSSALVRLGHGSTPRAILGVKVPPGFPADPPRAVASSTGAPRIVHHAVAPQAG